MEGSSPNIDTKLGTGRFPLKPNTRSGFYFRVFPSVRLVYTL